MVIFYTVAYNAAGTLRRTIDSVLAQTYGDWVYFCVDNGSADATGGIIRGYAARDGRVNALANKQNHVWEPGNTALDVTSSRNDSEYLCWLDADDEYTPNFLEKMLKFAESNHLDIACCGSDFIDSQTGGIIGARRLPADLIINEGEFSVFYPQCHQFMRTTWGKLLRLSTVRYHDETREPQLSYGGDTLFIQESMRKAKRIGIIADRLHKYYVSSKSTSYIWHETRNFSDRFLFDSAREFLIDKAGSVSPVNEEFLLVVYMNALIDTLQVLLNSELNEAGKIDALCEMFLCEHAKTLASRENFGARIGDMAGQTARRRELFVKGADWLLSRKEVAGEQVERFCELGEFLCAACGNTDGWVFCKKLRVRYLTDNNRNDEAEPLIAELNGLSEASKNKENVLFPRNGCDRSFYESIEHLKSTPVQTLLMEASASAADWIRDDRVYYDSLSKWYKSWYRVEKMKHTNQGFVNYFGNMYAYLQQHLDDLAWLYEELQNYRSKQQLSIILQHWLTFKPHLQKQGSETIFDHYFDLDIVKCDENEVFVDCGCYDGGTVKEFIKVYGTDYKSIYSYELTPSTYEKAKRNLKDIPGLFLRNAGVSNTNGQFPMLDINDNATASNRLHPQGNAMAKVVRIDDDIQEPVTFLKMDIEGAELDALYGAERQIRENKPKLAISLYHKLSDIVEIPRLVKSFVPEYKFYLQHSPGAFPFPTEYVLFAVM
jgi:FkbM family methyltransferase